jgi:murein DD-endopeptidase MepM/ murein hydrolase activator NlpD
VYCSVDCLRAGSIGIEPPTDVEPIAPPPRRIGWLVAAGGVVIGTAVWMLSHGFGDQAADAAEPASYLAYLPHPPPPRPPVVAPAPPPGPTPEELAQRAEDEALMRELVQDAWIHPLVGPRRMPINHTAAFGAERPGERPPECVSGHCGVDVGGSIWGEQVHAVHEGVVDTVNRGPNDEHGGVFVRIAHRGGTLYTWYFHLAAVPRWIHPGVKVTVGQVIGLVGDTGVKNSGPHLHFAMSVKPGKGAHERYLDPEPLIAIWPLWVPDERNGHVSTLEPPGMPVRAAARPKPRVEAPAAPSEPAQPN